MNPRHKTHLLSAAIVALGANLAVEPALAQAAPMLEEVVVTARKREESLQNTPLSIKALGAAELEDRNILSLGDLPSAVPNMSVQSSISRNTAGVFIRGIGGVGRSITTDPGVGLYIDGVYLARAQGGMLEMLDVERIEVLRGPQGTLYGRNTIGGAVNFITQKPDIEPSLQVKVGAGNYDLVTASATADLPLVKDTLLSKFAVSYANRDGFTTNVFSGDKWDDKNYFGARADFRWLASDTVTVDLSMDMSRRREESSGAQCVLQKPDAPLILLADYMIGLGYADACSAAEQLGDLKFSVDSPSRDDMEDIGGAATISWDLSPDLAFKSITAYRKLEWELFEDFDASPVPIFSSRGDDAEQEQVSQEFQLTGDNLGGRLNWTTGLYYFDEDVSRPAYSDFYLIGDFYQRVRGASTTSYAAYGQASFELADNWSLTAGIRYTEEERAFSNMEVVTATGEVRDVVNVDDTFDAVTPMLNLSWQATEDMMLYASWSQGYKSGGFNSRVSLEDPESLEPYQEETVDSYELGLKSTWLDQRVTANMSAYYSKYDDMQLQTTDVAANGSPLSLIRNAGESHILGLELELDVLLTSNWRIGIGYGLTDAEYDTFNTLDPVTGEYEDLTYLEFANTPEHSASVSSEWVLPMQNDWLTESRLRLDYAYSSSYFTDTDNTEAFKRDALNMLNASLMFDFNGGTTSVHFWGKNLTDEIYYRFGYSLGDSFGTGARFFGEPRTYGVSLSHTF